MAPEQQWPSWRWGWRKRKRKRRKIRQNRKGWREDRLTQNSNKKKGNERFTSQRSRKESSKDRERRRGKESESGHHTYVDLTENDVYYAANYDEEIKHIPRITKVSLYRMR